MLRNVANNHFFVESYCLILSAHVLYSSSLRCKLMYDQSELESESVAVLQLQQSKGASTSLEGLTSWPRMKQVKWHHLEQLSSAQSPVFRNSSSEIWIDATFAFTDDLAAMHIPNPVENQQELEALPVVPESLPQAEMSSVVIIVAMTLFVHALTNLVKVAHS